jgi:hypothetical protein
VLSQKHHSLNCEIGDCLRFSLMVMLNSESEVNTLAQYF